MKQIKMRECNYSLPVKLQPQHEQPKGGRRTTGSGPQSPSYTSGRAAALTVAALALLLPCVCDNANNKSSIQLSRNKPLAASNGASASPSSSSLSSSSSSVDAGAKASLASGLKKSKLDLERILSSIELQHLRAFNGLKKSKFDSGDERLNEIALAHFSPPKSGSSMGPPKPSAYGPSALASGGGSRAKVSAADQAMQSIMLAHEASTFKTAVAGPSSSLAGHSSPSSERANSIWSRRKVLAQLASIVAPVIAKSVGAQDSSSSSSPAPAASSKSARAIANVAPFSLASIQKAVKNATKPIRTRSPKSNLLSTIGDRALRAAMIKPSISFQEVVAEPQFSADGDLATSGSADSPRAAWSAASSVATPFGSVRGRNSSLVASTGVFQDSLRSFLQLTQLPLLTSNTQQLPLYAALDDKTTTSTAPTSAPAGASVIKATGAGTKPVPAALTLSEQRRKAAADEFLRFAYIISKRLAGSNDPLKALATSGPSLTTVPNKTFTQRSKNPAALSNRQIVAYLRQLRNLLLRGPRLTINKHSPANALITANGGKRLQNKIKPRGIVWDMATDPSLAVTLLHLIESASVALPLGILLAPFVRMLRNPLNGINLSGGLSRIVPTRATHRSNDHEEWAKRLDVMRKLG